MIPAEVSRGTYVAPVSTPPAAPPTPIMPMVAARAGRVPAPFVVFSLPRSRSAWLARFLTYGDWVCGHEEIRHCRTPEDIKAWLAQPCTGTVETAGAPFWRLLEKWRPDARVVVVRRPVNEVVRSFMALDLGLDQSILTRTMRRLDAKLDQIERRVPGVLSVSFDALADERTCARIFEHCLPHDHDPAWWRAVAALNIQINLKHLFRSYAAYQPQLTKLARVAKQLTIAGISRPRDIDGMTFQAEPLEPFWQDARWCFEEHLVQTGQSPDDHARKNLPLLRLLDKMGALQVITARCNGRVFGYLMSVLAPSLDSPEITEATHTIFFASPDAPGIGLKLQRAAIDALRARGVDEILMRAGHRGSGPRLGTIYRRLGAEEFGQLYRLELEG